MANAVASMAGLASQVVLESSLAGNRLVGSGSGSGRVQTVAVGRVVVVRAADLQQVEDVGVQSRRSLLSLAAASVVGSFLVKDARAVSSIKLQGPPPPSGGLPGTDNSDQARDVDLPLKERFYLQPKTTQEAADRIKVAVKEIFDVKPLIERKAWPYVQNGLRSSASYLRYDLQTVLASKPKEQKKALKALTAKALDSIDNLDYAARSKNQQKAEKAYSETVALLNEVLASV